MGFDKQQWVAGQWTDVNKGQDAKPITGLTNGTNYAVAVKAVDAAGNASDFSNAATAAPGASSDGGFAGGSGTPQDPWLVTTPGQLNAIRDNLSGHYKLGNDIDLTLETGDPLGQFYDGGQGWEPIGTESQRFTGTFDGDGHKVIGLSINRSSEAEIGLFGSVGNGGAVRNVGLKDGSVRGGDYTGGLVGYNVNGTIENTYSTVSVNGNEKVGGLVGQNDNRGLVKQSYAIGNVTGLGTVGGLVGRNDNSSTVSQSYATGSVNGQYEVGGLVGRHYGSIGYSYAVGRVTGGTDVGGLVGRSFGPTITSSFYNSETTGQSGTGTSKTTAEMRTKSTFTMAGWDFDHVWGMNSLINNGYPVLVPPYIVTYDENGATEGSVPKDGRTYKPDESVTVQGNSGNLAREGYSFVGWSLTSDGSGASYVEENIFTMGSSNVTLFAKWTPNGTIDPTTGSFDKYAPADVTTTLAVYGNTLIGIRNDDKVLSETADYTVLGNTVTIKKEYLTTQPVGEAELTFTFSAGPAQTLKITVTDTTPPPTAPPAPTGLQAAAGEGKVNLTWEAVEGAESYRVFKYEGAEAPADSGEWTLINDHEQTEPAYLVDNLAAGKQYWFAAAAVRSGKESGLSEPASAMPYTTVTEVVPHEDIKVGKGIALELLKNRFPEKVQVHVKSLLSLDLNVDWDLEHTDYNPDQAGTYKVTGQLQLPAYVRNPQSLQVELSVLVLANANARLSGIYLDDEPLQGFLPDLFTYTIEVPYETERVTVTAATYDAAATYEVFGGNLQLLKVGHNSMNILVTAEDQKEQTTYIINVDRKPDTEPPQWPEGSELIVSDITRNSVKLSWPTATDNLGVAGYLIDVDGKERTTVSGNVYATIVDSLTANTMYTFKVTAYDAAANEGAPLSRQAMTVRSSKRGGGSGGSSSEEERELSSNADLEELQVWYKDKKLELSPSFAADTTSYTARTEAGQVEIAAKPAYFAAKVMLKDKLFTDRTKVDLEEGDNKLLLIVEAENGSKKEYTLTVRRETPQTSEPIVHFTDIAGHWAESDIKRAAAKGIVSGYPEGAFKPSDPVTRAEFTVMLAGAIKLDGQGATLTFADQNQIGEWAKQAIARAVESGIVNGYADGSFRSNDPITRAEMAVMIARALKLQNGAHASTGFADDEAIPQWAKGATEAIRELGIVDGRGQNRFVPNENATRVEAAIMLLRMLDHKED
ncbi:S-layer homology domain-containing protein [Paenibacillus doosanensis]|uniref:S-layer homology domain-containing protein n=1 Tax=Paenibacillus doosanensis TaxID=1229154 RepID=UPI00217F30DD|nr:S-layer homology domain-containing protein [Paenibacillus doosanensis]MCS7460393.1 S-layer homology domain-containing protein [Paenibacillus doosanensis]